MSPIALESCPTVDVPGRTFIATEPTERFFAYGRLILAPAAGMVVETHYGEVDHMGRRSQLTLVPLCVGAGGAHGRAAAGSSVGREEHGNRVKRGRGPEELTR